MYLYVVLKLYNYISFVEHKNIWKNVFVIFVYGQWDPMFFSSSFLCSTEQGNAYSDDSDLPYLLSMTETETKMWQTKVALIVITAGWDKEFWLAWKMCL